MKTRRAACLSLPAEAPSFALQCASPDVWHLCSVLKQALVLLSLLGLREAGDGALACSG